MALQYSYQCSCGNEFYQWNEISKAGEPMPCPECGELANRQYGFAIAKTRSSMMSRAWEKKHTQKLAQERKQKG